MILTSMIGITIILVLGIFFFNGLNAHYPPRVKYDFSTFTENKKLSEDLTASVRKYVSDTSGEHKYKHRQPVLSRLGALNIKEVQINLLKGFKNRQVVGYDFFFNDGKTFHEENHFAEYYKFPMVIVFNADGTFTVKTNGDELKIDYATRKEQIAENMNWLLFTGTSALVEKLPEYKAEQAKADEIKKEQERIQLEKNKNSWK